MSTRHRSRIKRNFRISPVASAWRVKQTNLPQAFIGCSMRRRVHCFIAVGAGRAGELTVWCTCSETRFQETQLSSSINSDPFGRLYVRLVGQNFNSCEFGWLDIIGLYCRFYEWFFGGPPNPDGKRPHDYAAIFEFPTRRAGGRGLLPSFPCPSVVRVSASSVHRSLLHFRTRRRFISR